jgi:hypothetical protein
MQATQQMGICRQVRFVLWSLRWAVQHHRGDAGATAQVALGFALHEIQQTTSQFWRFADALCTSGMTLETWHHPDCACASLEELMLLHLLAATANRQARRDPTPCPSWSLLVPPHAVAAVDQEARHWLAALADCGVLFPDGAELIASLGSIESLAGPPMGGHRGRSAVLH